MTVIPLAPDSSSITQLEQSLEKFINDHMLDMELQLRLNLMLEELVSNVINYSLQMMGDNPMLEVRLFLKDGFVVAQLEDNGASFNPFDDAPEADTSSALEERPIGGLGVLLTKKLADDYAYERINGHNRVILQCKIEGDIDGDTT